MKYSYNIIGLDCANCAREIEESLNRDSNFKDVVVNFSTSRISFYSDKDISIDELNRMIKKIEPSAYVSDSDDVSSPKEYYFSVLIIAVLFGVLGMHLPLPNILKYIFIFISYVLLLYRPFVNAVKMLVRSHTINENALISISCIGALLVGSTMEGIMVVALYTLGKILEEKAINNTRKSIKNLMEIKQDFANVKRGSSVEIVDVSLIKPGDKLVVKKGERVPVDGVITKGAVTLDMSMLTGESELCNLNKGENVLSGSVNMGEVFEMKASELYENSTVARILELTMSAGDKKAKTETIVTKFSKIYTPIVLCLAVLTTFILPLFGVSFIDSIYRGLTFLVISCPCAIAISVPLSYFTGIGVASSNGILIKGSNYLDNLVHLKKIIFDKTGTLTTGSFKVTNIDIISKEYSKDELIKIIAHGESFSNHPIAKCIVSLYKGKINNKLVKDFKEITGKGLSFEYDGKIVKIGSKSICDDCLVDTTIHVNIDGVHVCSIELDDGIKKGAFDAIKRLKSFGVSTMMFTGDKKDMAISVGKRLEIDDVKYEMLPEDKFKEYEKVASSGLTAFVGDGINDAPVIKRSDIGIAMGGVGSSSAIEASDIVIMTDDLMKIPKSIEISKYTNYIIKQNLIFAIGVKVVILLLSMFGIATMWFAVFADTGVTLITILNTLRIRKNFK